MNHMTLMHSLLTVGTPSIPIKEGSWFHILVAAAHVLNDMSICYVDIPSINSQSSNASSDTVVHLFIRKTYAKRWP